MSQSSVLLLNRCSLFALLPSQVNTRRRPVVIFFRRLTCLCESIFLISNEMPLDNFYYLIMNIMIGDILNFNFIIHVLFDHLFAWRYSRNSNYISYFDNIYCQTLVAVLHVLQMHLQKTINEPWVINRKYCIQLNTCWSITFKRFFMESEE